MFDERIHFFAFFAFFLILFGGTFAAKVDPLPNPLDTTGDEIVVKTKIGKIRGLVVEINPALIDSTAETPSLAYTFLGVRYAQPQIRFERPIPPTPWKGIKNATAPMPACVPFIDAERSRDYDNPISEDCLWLDIYAPSFDVDQQKHKFLTLLPVQFYIHGGGFENGTPLNTPKQRIIDLYVSRGIIVVMVSYRLGFLGFATNGQPGFRGNFGLWDQAQALRWVNEHIQSFGGDPRCVTVMGNSAGAASTSALALSPQTQNLFKQTIQLSGSIFAGWAFKRDWMIDETDVVASALGCGADLVTFSNTQMLLDCLRSKTIEDIWDAVYSTGYSRFDVYQIRFSPWFDNDFFPDDPEVLIRNAPIKPTITGFTETEMIVYMLTDYDLILNMSIPKEKWSKFDQNDLRDFVHERIALKEQFGSDKTSRRVQHAISNFYLKNKRQRFTTNSDNFYLKANIDMTSDIYFTYPSMWEARKKAQLDWPVYFYLLTSWQHETTTSDLPIRGSYHSIEQGYWWNLWFYPLTSPFPQTYYTPGELNMIKFSLDSFVQFMKTGNPTLKDRRNHINWPMVKSFGHELDFVRLDEQSTVEKGLWEDVYDFFNRLRKGYNQFDIIRANGAPSR